MDPRKGHDKIIAALSNERLKDIDFMYIVAGKGDDRDRLSGLAQDLEIRDRIIFVGPIDEQDKAGYYDASDVFIMLNRQDNNNVEGFGISFIEAGARKKPVIGCYQGGAIDAVNENTGFLLKGNNLEEEAVDCILSLINDPSMRNEMGEASLNRILKEFSWRKISKDIYQ
ncbi:glycosyltransferase family 4 protein [Alkalicoccobacillus plakortidis]|uniref:Glycosyltransferase family 4 protein n=1 Tax=Alkalicoccobacillus plakortidis TaxID=444060 RepID=A0ABT0XKM0_9BACI|nr:glycosyltransferase family 4 protein [Alkalicoccobacillus plakortidis]MCM2675913.1 glycosyltransferase family 4 protein [Alkalicoccobacillus plakortidis]